MAGTLRCQCGSGALVIERQSYSDDSAFEQYRCETCKQTGTLTMVAHGSSQKTGCLE